MLLFNAVQLGTLTWVSVGIWGSRGTGHLFLFPALNFFSASEVSAWCSCRISLFFPPSRKALLTLRCLIQFSLSAEPQTVSVCLSVHPSHWVSHFHTKPPLMLIALLGPLAESLSVTASSDDPLPPWFISRQHHGNGDKRAQLVLHLCWPGNRCHQACQLWGNRPDRCQQRDDCSVKLTFFFLSPFSSSSLFISCLSLLPLSFLYIPASLLGEEAHHRPVWGPERWTQPDFLAGSPLWSHPGKGFLSLTHTFISYLTAIFSITHTLLFQFQAYKSSDCYVSRFHTWLLGQFWDNDVGTSSSVSLLFLMMM